METDNNKEVKRILAEINGMATDDYGRFLQSPDRHYVAAMAESLTRDERNELFKETSIGGYLEKRYELIDKRTMPKIGYVMRPIAEVLADFSDSKSGKRTEARKELQFRFETQAWKDQVDILTAMLETDTKADTAWVAKILSGEYRFILLRIFDFYLDGRDKFRELLFPRCEKHLSHPDVATFMVDYMPQEYVDRHLDELERIVGYRKLCARLALVPNYTIDESKLTLFQYLDVLSKTNRTPKQQPIWDRLCEWFHNIDADEVSWESRSRYGWTEDNEASGLSLTNISEVRWLVKSCGAIHLPGLICAVYDLDQRVKERLRYTQIEIPNDPIIAFAHYKKLLVEFAKEEIDNVDTSSLPKDVTVMQRLQPTFDRLKIVPQSQADGEFIIQFLDSEALMGTNDFTNTYYFKKALAVDCSKEAFLAAVEEIKEQPQYQRLVEGLWTDYEVQLCAQGMPVFHEGIAAPIFRSSWRRFISACEKAIEELSDNMERKS